MEKSFQPGVPRVMLIKQEKNPKVSIVMPVYQREAFLNDSIKCILGQTYNDFESICVDDGSTDNSGRICDEYAAKEKYNY